MNESLLLWTIEPPLATITLNRPDKLNALSPAMLSLLDTALAEIEARHDVYAVILTGAGERAFCVGADIHAWGGLEPLDMWRHWIRDGHRIFDRLARLRQPTIAALNGFTLGGGLELAMACDMRLCTEAAQLGQPEVAIGTIPGWGGTQRLPQLIGTGRAKQMIFSGQRIDAATAERWGLVNEVVPAADLNARAQELAQQIAQNAPLAVQFAKQAIDGGGAALEALAGALAATTADGREGLASFRERRPADYQGE